MKLCMILVTTILSLTSIPAVSAGSGQQSGITSAPSGTGGAKKKFVVTQVTVKVGETKFVSTGAGTQCKSADSEDNGIAKAKPNDGAALGGFEVEGVATGEVLIKYTWKHGDKEGAGHCIVTVVP